MHKFRKNILYIGMGVLCIVSTYGAESNNNVKLLYPKLQPPPNTHVSKNIVNTKGGKKVSQVSVKGNIRISTAKILQVFPLRKGNSISPKNLNIAIKELYATDLFHSIKVNVKGNELIVVVKENPIVHNIKFDGNSAVSTDVIENATKLKELSVFTEKKLKGDIQTIQRLYNYFGHYSVNIKPEVKHLKENRVDITYHIVEGDKTTIDVIRFVGNKEFSDSTLRGILQTKEWAWYRFLSSNTTYDPQRLQYDEQLLTQYYTTRGYADFSVLNVSKDISKDGQNLFVTFTVKEGIRYHMGTVTIASDIPDIDPQKFEKYLPLKKGNLYDGQKIRNFSNQLVEILNENGYNFVDVRPQVDLKKEQASANVTFQIVPIGKNFVNRIIIRGNTRSNDAIIRRVLTIHEGDPLNYAKIRESQNNIYGIGFFKNVNISPEPLNNTPGKVNLIVTVAEAGTTNVFLSGGYSSVNGFLAQVTFSDRNFLGTGNGMSTALTWTQKNVSLSANWVQPYFLNRYMTLGVSGYFLIDTSDTVSSYKSRSASLTPSVTYDLYKDWQQKAYYTIRDLNIFEVNTSSQYVVNEKGNHVASIIGQVVYYDKRNNTYAPTSGYLFSLDTSFAGIGGNEVYLKNLLRGMYYYPVTYSITLKLSATYGNISGLGDKVLLFDRFFAGGEDLRGFADSEVGPRGKSAGDVYIGGTQKFISSVSLAFPLGFSKDFGLTGSLFTEWGTVWDPLELDPQMYYNSGTLRGDVGFALHWQSPIGPMSFSWAFPIKKEAWDTPQLFRFSVGGQF